MGRPRRHHAVAIALYINAALLFALVVILLSRDGSPRFMPAAFAQEQPPIAGGGGVFVMPAQFSVNTWGCYLLDIDAQTLCVYQFYPGDKQLRLLSARNFRFDRRLNNFNTFPMPREVEELLEKERADARVLAPNEEQKPSPEAGQ